MPARIEIGHRADGFLDRHVRIDAMQVVQIDDLDTETPRLASQAARTYAGRPLITRVAASAGSRCETELGREHDAARVGP